MSSYSSSCSTQSSTSTVHLVFNPRYPFQKVYSLLSWYHPRAKNPDAHPREPTEIHTRYFHTRWTFTPALQLAGSYALPYHLVLTADGRLNLISSSIHRPEAFICLKVQFGVASPFVMGHHVFYASYDGLKVAQASISQEWVIRIGTGFAFLAKTLLVVAASIAFVQQQWLALSHQSFKVRQIDSMTGNLNNALSFFESRIWFRFPLLTLLAVITPATISVVGRLSISTLETAVPQLDFDPSRYADLQTDAISAYISSSPDTLRIAYGSAMTRRILSIEQEYPNMTYTLQFFGPGLRCDDANADLVSEVNEAMGATQGHKSNFLDCKLYNASYRAVFNLTFPNQDIRVESRELVNPVSASKDISVWEYQIGRSPDEGARRAQGICYQSVMEAFGRLLVGWETQEDGEVITWRTCWRMMAMKWNSGDDTRTGLGSLFENITLSMLSASPLIMNATVAAQNLVPVNITTSVNVFSYNAGDLWRAYGIACGITLISTLLGSIAIWRNGSVGYQNVFSTFVRTTRGHELQSLIEPDDRGTEPLPRKIAETSIVLDI
ncbi:hypothetical protein M011DRAFT_525633 [Sporormia fimetaria CBS 119925]|uniref:Uncharacterized protein n=1 Tax=Sporormia fimetaria CBS 119925 TaxID=1340428 RepID=A0A6A6VD58_9PLEO|nr:hypothetical protein M011DRAFT_525633 [Sporormia fimetaria CBS 119925]